ncbi:hypothetical protein AB1Y20_014125 [Prymnesium parvum]|uniref:Phosphoglycerate mutase (2,3-diphosphoglycerate-dependent) n=1 Tax=Prymnesium parvum TaxID=97485 RepID=A0AB34II05_PRYPA
MFPRLARLRPFASRFSSSLCCPRFSSSLFNPRFSSSLCRPRCEEVVLIRHGESEGNVAYNRSVAGDHSLYSGDFMDRHSGLWRLTDRGREQARAAGAWLASSLSPSYGGYFTSEYLRAMETAALLALPSARWRPDVMLRERDWGGYDLASQAQRASAYARYEQRRRRESLFWAPPGGESLAQVVHRVDSMLLFLNRRYDGQRVVAVCHGELMWAFRLRFECLTQLTYRDMQASPKIEDRIHNCQILVYSRRCPFSSTLHQDFRFVRSVCPWNLKLSGGDEWRPLARSGGFSDEELLEQCARFPRMYNSYDELLSEPPTRAGDPEVGLSCSADASAAMPHSSSQLTAPSLQASRRHAKVNAEGTEAPAAVRPSVRTSAERECARRVVLLTKTSRWRLGVRNEASEHEGSARDEAAGGGGEREEIRAGEDTARLSCERHEVAVQKVSSELAAVGFEVVPVPARSAVAADVADAEMVCVLGGDGTVLRAARLAPAGTVVVGINTDPHRSMGKLCAVEIPPGKEGSEIASTLSRRLYQHDYQISLMPQLRVTVATSSDDCGVTRTVSSVLRGVNEAFLGEADPSRPFDFEMSVDGGPFCVHRSSGAIIATQLGSGAWLRAAWQVHDEQVRAILGALGEAAAPLPRGVDIPSITAAATRKLLRHDDPMAVQYLVREPTPQLRGRANPWQTSDPHGMAATVCVRPLGWEAVLTLDGLPPLRLPNSCSVTVQVEPEKNLWLHTATFPDESEINESD